MDKEDLPPNYCVTCKWRKKKGWYSDEMCTNPNVVIRAGNPVTGYASCIDGRRYVHACSPTGKYWEPKEC